MRFPASRSFSAGLVVAGALLSGLACNDANEMTAPVSSPAAASVAGTWKGTFHSDSDACGTSQLTATFQQDGAQVSGNISGTSCGSSGVFKGTVTGNRLIGNIEMLGCSGGAVNATVSASGLEMTMGDLTRPISMGQEVVMYGGSASLER